MSEECIWINIDLVLLHEPTHRCDLSYTFHGFEDIAKIPVLNGAQLRQIKFASIIDEGVLVNPADSSRVWTDSGIHTFWKRTANGIEIFKHPRPGPIHIRTVFKNDVNERFTEDRFATDELHFWSGNECARDW